MKNKTKIIKSFRNVSKDAFEFQKEVSQELIDTRKEVKELNEYVGWLENTLQSIEIKEVDTSGVDGANTYNVDAPDNCCTATDFAKEANDIKQWAKDMGE